MSELRLVADSALPEAEPESPPSTTQLALSFATTADESPTPGPSTEAHESMLPDDGAAFVARLADAMQSLLPLERARIGSAADERERLHVELIRERSAAGAERLRTFGADEALAIEQWVESETRRIEQEGERRKRTLERRVEDSLAAHRSTFDRAIEESQTLIGAYRAEVDDYFHRLESESDPAVIAEYAGRRPGFPDLPDIPEFDALGHARRIAGLDNDDVPGDAPAVSDPGREPTVDTRTDQAQRAPTSAPTPFALADVPSGDCPDCASARDRRSAYCGSCGRDLADEPSVPASM